MPIKLNITKPVILKHALELIRESGVEGLNARSLAAHIGYSTQPIFSVYKNMGELWEDLTAEAEKIYSAFVERIVESGEFPEEKAKNVAHIKFAICENFIFRLLFIDKAEQRIKELYQSEGGASFATSHGLAVIYSTAKLPWSDDIVDMI